MLQKLGGGTPKGRVMLLAFYITKALGVRYLEGALERAGYQVQVVFIRSLTAIALGRPAVENWSFSVRRCGGQSLSLSVCL